jgi:predicted regulator of Ras-like GTPase activity (Roadblock/LC7/MglB family)
VTLFSYLLTNLLVDVPQAVGAIFVDPEGEAVEWVTRHGDPFDLKVEGAYHSIFLRRLDSLTASADAGSISSVVLEGSRLVTLTQALPDGYYVVLVVDRKGSPAQALYHLRHAARAFAEQLG